MVGILRHAGVFSDRLGPHRSSQVSTHQSIKRSLEGAGRDVLGVFLLSALIDFSRITRR